MSLSIVTVLRSGKEYQPKHVQALFKQVDEHIKMPFRFYCLTDMFFNIDGINIKTLRHNWPLWWSKVELFRPDLFPAEEQLLFFDLDTLICGDIRPLGQYRGEFGMLWSSRSNCFVNPIMSWKSGYGHEFYENFEPDKHIEKHVYDDRYIMSHESVKPDNLHNCFPKTRIARYSNILYIDFNKTSIVIFHGNNKPWTSTDTNIRALYSKYEQ